jgi:hypothetical protein
MASFAKEHREHTCSDKYLMFEHRRWCSHKELSSNTEVCVQLTFHRNIDKGIPEENNIFGFLCMSPLKPAVCKGFMDSGIL